MSDTDKTYYIGLMAGTSLDGIDAVLVDFNNNTPTLHAHYCQAFPTELKTQIKQLIAGDYKDSQALKKVDTAFAKLSAQTCLTLLATQQIAPDEVIVIGSHGQTIYHDPAKFSLQIGAPAIISHETGITTVADFRQADIAVGGQGAPLAPAFHHAFFYQKGEARTVVNIGGIANISVLNGPAIESTIGFDSGPGNTLLDAWTEKFTGQPFDQDGAYSATGVVNQTLLDNLLTDTYFQQTPPKSTGPEHFNLAWLDNHLQPEMDRADVARTLVALTAHSIINAINVHTTSAQTIILCGGGVHNQTLVSELKSIAGPHQIATSDQYGVDPDYLEAIGFAWLAKQTLAGKTSNIPNVTGAKTPCVLGTIHPAYEK